MSKITIAFPQGGIIPGAVLGKSEDVHVDALAPITVPERYGRHLIADRFAVEVAAPEKPKKKSVTPSSDASAALAAAEAAVAAAQEKLATAGDDLAAKAEAETEVKAAEAALAALKS
ncbi:hypothetical protein G6N76_10975 [Rhizobium daejeonense]|uniref:Uncharacterized protein n=1 Tax=Rhizobium daejeonense TaxID=240521 RepID=A0A6M1S4W4_9HYPH|nr:hypothetical protein [Rhizobium daejeonense]NGO64200.1 hypothetical protein [Rhizobium daejeonense]